MRFVSEGMEPEELAGVATVSVELGARLLMPFTADRRQLLATIRSVGMPAGTDGARDPLGFSLPAAAGSAARPGARLAPAARDSPRADTRDDDNTPRLQMEASRQKSADALATSRVERQLKALNGLAQALDAVTGSKTIVFFSEGFDERLLAGKRRRPQQRRGQRSDAARAVLGDQRGQPISSGPLLQALAETLEQFHHSECAVYPVDLGSPRLADTGQLDSEHRGSGSLAAIAKGSGGQVVPSVEELNPAVGRLRERASVTYVLVFQPGQKQGEGRYHKLKVRVNRSGTRVEARAGYYEKTGFARLSPLQRSLSAADAIAGERESNGFPMQLLAFSLDAGPASRVPVVLEISGSELLAKEPVRSSMRLAFYVYAVSEAGELEDSLVRSVRLDLTNEAARLKAGPLRYRGQLRLSPGRYRLRALARDEEQGRSAFRAVSVEVKETEAAGGLRASVPLFLSATDAGITLLDASGGSTSPDPFQVGGEPFLPDLAPALTASEPARVCLFLATRGPDPDVQIQGRIHGEAGGDWGPGRLAVRGRTAPDAEGLWKILLVFEPAALPPGTYRLSITLRSSAEPSVPVVREASFRIR